jgi:hypothetical protein
MLTQYRFYGGSIVPGEAIAWWLWIDTHRPIVTLDVTPFSPGGWVKMYDYSEQRNLERGHTYFFTVENIGAFPTLYNIHLFENS